jgi:deoxyribonuclease V
MIRTKLDPQWAAIVEQWKQTQQDLRRKMIVAPLEPLPRWVAGADVAFSKDKQTVFAAAVVYDRVEQRIVEIAHAHRAAEFPYVPGFLAFREGPALFGAIAALKRPWEAILFDGQGYAHPRRCGLAAYMSISLDVPGVGVAKSRLIGTFAEPPAEAGGFAPLMDEGEEIGSVLRTRDGVRPLFVSLGHRVDLESARQLVLACCTRYRIPEPTRQADIEVAKLKRQFCAASWRE